MLRTGLCVLAALLASSPAFAQTQQPIPPFVIDARGFSVGFGTDELTATDLGIVSDNLPKRGWGGAVGVTLYPIRRSGFALGIGGEGLLAWGKAQPIDAEGVPVGLPLRRRLQSLAGQLSFNFGHRDGWSYVSGGMGPLVFETYAGDTPPETRTNDMTLNFGGGARWFTSRHLAFCFDLRFYETKPALTTLTTPGRERKRLLVLSVGAAFK